DFHMVGAVDFNATNDTNIDGNNDDANVTNIDDLQSGTTDFLTASTTPGLYIKEFTKSGFDSSNTLNTIEGIDYDRTQFEANGAKLLSNVSQIVTSTNKYSTASTKLIDSGSFNTTTVLHLEGTQIDGITPYSVNIDFTGNPVTVNGIALQDGFGNNTTVADMTYQQLADVVNMAVTGETTIADSYKHGKTSLSYDGKLTFEDLDNPVTQATLAMYDSSSSDYTVTNGSSLTFNANNALTIRDPKTDFFAQIEEVIRSVEEGKTRADGSDPTDPRNIGIQNSIQIMDDLSNHISKLQAESGSYSQVLEASSNRSDLLIVSTKMLQSDVIDTDIAEATLRMQQLSLNYQAMFSSISKVSQLSLVNYL
ncbi:MAG: flagellar biosynthesis protein FlgL, partial [Sulfuricurvum sp.]